MTGDQIREFEEVISEGGLAIFPTDTVYGLGTHPDSVEGTHRLYWIKGRSPDRPAPARSASWWRRTACGRCGGAT